MRVVRTLLALVLGLSVAMLPAAAGFLSAPALAATHVSATHDCCDEPAAPCETTMDQCQSMATCALKCFSFAGTALPSLAAPFVMKSVSLPSTDVAYGLIGHPPFRPPRG